MSALKEYNLETLVDEYKQADLQPKKKTEEHPLLNHHDPVWAKVLPVGLMIVFVIILFVGGIGIE